MSITEDTYLPTDEELTVSEVNVSGPVLKASAFHLGGACEAENHEFVLCRNETGDPRACLAEGRAVTSCALKFFQQVKKSCYGEFMQYVNCIDKSSSDQSFKPCRQTQGVFDKCMKDNLNMDRLPHDYYSRAHVIEAKRERPAVEPECVYPDPTPYLPEGTEKPPAKYGNRYHWMW